MNKHIIPYPGLRPFTEEEAIFFKGRDQHIRQIITQLQERKIVIVTGASGDGKSSLIYAGVIPNARAGFFKATFNNWVITDFRPERSPLRNLSESVAQGLEMDLQQVYEELQFGFSSLVNIYKHSKYYIDFDSQAWKNASEQERKQLRSSAANLMIIADQFEEFFTNPENFAAGKPSIEAYTTVNLLLETARIAIRDNLPIYIIFTMRSDFISDCVAFKGLPEFIGFSQFFVPRLKRNELRQVIEEPARLAGGSVSNRLTEVLINDLREGHDQLPVLQHTLNRLWRVADYGGQEMDLIHLAKIGGLHPDFLDEKDKVQFQAWFDQLPGKQKVYFQSPSLNNVLNLHANTLYDSAFDYFQNNAPWAEKNINEQDTHLIIKTSFIGLTRIDDGRAVRNRMSLRELSNLISNEHISYEHVNGVMNIFREPDSTFIRPFINPEDIDTQYLSPDTVLDITHEALIRNWELLKEWEKEEEENFNDFQEFHVQLRRWLDSGKKDEYLLALGPLSYFEAWYERCRPNKYWLAKNDRSETDPKRKLKKAEKLEQEIREFLQRSREYIKAQERRKRRLRTILSGIALVLILILSGLVTWAMQEKKNAEYQRSMAEHQKEIAEKQKEIAEKQKNEAIKANRVAEQQKRRAELEALKALKEKRKADSLLRVALKLKAIAEEQSRRAQMEAQRAIAQKKKADSLRILAEQQRQKAIEASKRANRLSILSLAQSLAYKATANYKDPQVNLLLAYYAYILTRDYGGDVNMPEIFKGLYAAYQKINLPYVVELSLGNVMGFYPIDNQNIYLMDDKASVYKFNINTRKLSHITLRGRINRMDAVHRLWWDESDNFFLKDKGFNIWHFNLVDKTVNLVETQGENVRYASMTIDGRIIMFLKSGGIKYYSVDARGKARIDKELRLKYFGRAKWGKREVAHVVPTVAKDIFYVVTKDGHIMRYNVVEGKDIVVYDLHLDRLHSVSTVSVSNNGNYLSLGNGIGSVYIIDLRKDTLYTEFSLTNSNVKQILYDFDNTRMTIICPDNFLNIYKFGEFEKRPIGFSPIGDKIIRAMDFGTQIIGVTKNKVFWVYPDSKSYAEIIYKHIKRNFSKQEWQLFMQNLIPQFDVVK